MTSFQKINNLFGCLIFLISLFVYGSTIESSTSLWDCGEFISGAYKLQVVHPPGAPLFLMIGRIFTLFAGSEAKVPVMVNLLSAVSTALAVMFLFWTITMLARKIIGVREEKNMTVDQIIAVIGAGAVGALACTFSDTMWFSAVEGEVYALSIFFIAIVLWGAMKWEANADKPHGNKWILFIAFMLGLSIGVHLLSLLVMPILALIYYFKKFKATPLGVVIALVMGLILIGIVQVGVIQILTGIATKVELMAVNSFGLPFNIGIALTYIVVFGLLIFGIYYATKVNHADIQLALLSMLFVLIGFSSYLMVPIRANAGTPINMNAPKDAFSLLSYLNREQYGDRPLLKGPLFDAKPVDTKVTGVDYFPNKETGKYEVKKEKLEYIYRNEDKVLFPRMYSTDGTHIQLYRNWVGFKGKPTFAHNIQYFFKYQIRYMWYRYFMWNFSGRQDDFQGTFSNQYINGNWLSGLPPVDNARIGSQQGLPAQIKNQKARNMYYMLPFLFGIIGLIFLFNKSQRWALIFFYLFLMTGIFLIVYFNSPPREPRERDYTSVGSFFTYCVFIGMGVIALYSWLKDKIPAMASATFATVLGMVAVPTVMAINNWDDHNRHDRRMARDFANNYLESCPPNAILFTQGDNDTYPLWYAQEVEGIRTDVRIANLSLLGVDWYIEHLQKASNDAAPIPFHSDFTIDKYRGNKRDIIQFFENKKVAKPGRYYPVDDIVEFMLSDNKNAKARSGRGDEVNYMPTKKFLLEVDTAAVLRANLIPESLKNRIVSEIKWENNKRNIIKYDLAIMAMLAALDWERPLCFANTVSPRYYKGLEKYLIQEGLIYKFVPVNFPSNSRGAVAVNDEVMYNNVMEKFKYGGLGEKEHFIDENTHRMMHVLRGVHLTLAEDLNRKGKKEESINVLERVKEQFTNENAPYYAPNNSVFNIYTSQWVDLYYRNNARELAKPILDLMIEDLADCMRFYDLNTTFAKHYKSERQTALGIIGRLDNIAKQYSDNDLKALLVENFPNVVKPNGEKANAPEIRFQ